MKKAKHARRPHIPRPNFRVVIDLLDEAGDSCDNIAALAQLLRHDPAESTNRIAVLLYREASKLHDSLHELERHARHKLTRVG